MSSDSDNARPPTKRAKKESTEVSQAILKLDQIAKGQTEEKRFDQFAKFVASELRLLPEREGLLLEQEIYGSITRARLAYLQKREKDSAVPSDLDISFVL